MNAELSDDAHDAWRAFAARHGISVTALMQALGEELPAETLEQYVERARAVDAERRERG